MNRLRKVLSCLLIAAMLLPLFPRVESQAAEIDDYVLDVLDNYEEYLEASQKSHWLLYDERYHYELIAEEMKNASFSKKLDMVTAYDVLDRRLSVDDCIQYLSTVIAFTENGMGANIEAQSEYDTTKKAADYVNDAGTIVGEAIGFQQAFDLAKDVQNGLGLASDTLEFLMDVEEGASGFVAAMQEYSNQKEFLSVVAEHATYQKMREAANIMMAVQECQTAYLLDYAYDQFSATGKYMINAGDDLLEEGFESWLEDKKFMWRLEWKWSNYVKVDELLTVARQVHHYFKITKVVMSTAALASDIFIGNVYCYLKEVMLMDDITAALHKGIEKFDPQDEISYESQFAVLKTQVPLLEALCAVRARGEYCANMIAQANDTLFDVFVRNDNEYTEILERDLELIDSDYRKLSEIFLVDDHTVSVIWHYAEEETKLNNGIVFCRASMMYPEVSYSNESGMDNKISKYFSLWAEEWKRSYLEDFGWKGPDMNWTYPYDKVSHHANVSVNDIGRLDQSVISFSLGISNYYAGAAHPIHYSEIFNFNTKTGELLTLGSIVENQKAYDKLCDLASQFVDPKKADQENIRENAGTVLRQYGTEDCYPDWYFSNDGLCISYAPYAIASYMHGYILSTIPYSELKGVVKEEYLMLEPRSEKGMDVHGEVVDVVDITDSDRIYFCDGPGDGKYMMAFSSDEIVYDVTVCETEHATPDYQNVYIKRPLITLSTLSPKSVIILNCGASEDVKIPNLVVKWTDGTGKKRMSMFGADKKGELIEIMVN